MPQKKVSPLVAAHHNNGRASHGVIMLVKDNIKIDRVRRGLDTCFDEQWEGRILAVYTKGICFVGVYMPHHTDARDLLRDQIRAFEKRSTHAIILMTDINSLLSPEDSLTVVQPVGIKPGGEFAKVELITPEYFTSEYEGQHVMLTPQPHLAIMCFRWSDLKINQF